MKAKQSSGLNHTTTGRRGSLALHDYLRAACSRAGWQAGGSEQPVSGESFVVSRPLGPAVAAPGAGDPECSSEEPLPVPGAGRWGGWGWHLALASLCCRKAETRPERSPGTFWPEWREGPGKGSTGPRAPPTLPTFPWPGKHPEGSGKSEPEAVCLFSPAVPVWSAPLPHLHLYPSLFVLCDCSLSLPISLSLGFFYLFVSDHPGFSLPLPILHTSSPWISSNFKASSC